MEYQKIHIGSLIKSEVKRRKMTFTEFAGCIGIQRQNVERKVFSKQGLDTELLIQISEVLDFDFFKYFQNKATCNNQQLYGNTNQANANLKSVYNDEQTTVTVSYIPYFVGWEVLGIGKQRSTKSIKR